jgi:protein-S-isoprenylcysteine O-methyltransferase Ste14
MLPEYIEWSLMVVGWTVMFVVLSITRYKTVKVGGGIISMKSKKMIRETLFANIILIIYFLIAGLIAHLVLFPDFIQYEFLAHYFHFFVGVFIFAIAIWLYIIARIALGSNWTWKGELLRDRTRLIKRGPYCAIRNPTYTAFILAGFASGIMTATTRILFFMILMLPIIYWRAKVDENHLKEIFPEYKDYMKNTRMFF